AAHNLELIDRADRFLELGLPVLLGPSRKAFIRQVLSKNADTEFSPDSPGVEAGTLAAVAAATMKGVHIVRVHDVASSKAAVRIADSIRNKELFS
ncbi:MAG: dihydropteroate synthase, partial [Desulfobacterales bacterium]|nr:dihydropteroate synthase [Desulfobacterales bacterium]